MKNIGLLNAVLLILGLAGLVVGAGMVFFPVEFHATAGIELNSNINLVNEMRAAGGPPLLGGLIVILGAFIDRLKFAATLIAGALYLSYGFARLIGIAIDGLPSTAILQIAAFEILAGTIATAAFFYFYQELGRRTQTR